MQSLKLFAGSSALFLFPVIAFAQLAQGQGNANPLATLLEAILVFTNDILIPFVIGIGFLMFVWGIFLYFIAGGANDEKKEKGKSLMIYAILGFILIFVFWGIINLLAETTGLQGDTIDGIVPTIPQTGATI